MWSIRRECVNTNRVQINNNNLLNCFAEINENTHCKWNMMPWPSCININSNYSSESSSIVTQRKKKCVFFLSLHHSFHIRSNIIDWMSRRLTYWWVVRRPVISVSQNDTNRIEWQHMSDVVFFICTVDIILLMAINCKFNLNIHGIAFGQENWCESNDNNLCSRLCSDHSHINSSYNNKFRIDLLYVPVESLSLGDYFSLLYLTKEFKWSQLFYNHFTARYRILDVFIFYE